MLTADDLIQVKGKPNPEAFAEYMRKGSEFIQTMENKINSGTIGHNDLTAMLEMLKVYFTAARLLGELEIKNRENP